jgi:hypothetical protein
MGGVWVVGEGGGVEVGVLGLDGEVWGMGECEWRVCGGKVRGRGMPEGEVWRLGEEGMSMASGGYSGWVGDKQRGVGVIH